MADAPEMDDPTPFPSPAPHPHPVILDRSDESLDSEADSVENTESELGLLGWNYKTGQNDEIVGEIGDTPHKVRAYRQELVSNVKPSVADADDAPTDEDDAENGQLKDIFYMLIPYELTDLIFRRLDLISKLSARTVCKRWNDLIDNGNLLSWHPELFDETSDQVLEFARKGYPVESLEISKLENFEYPVKGLGMDVHGIEFVAFSYSPIPLPICISGISNTNLDKLLHEYRGQLHELHLNSRAFAGIDLPSAFRTTDFSNLDTLELSTSNADGRGYYVCLDALDNTFPKLKTLKLRLLYHRETIFLQHPPYYRQIFSFILQHTKTLRDVCVSYCNLADERSIPPFVFDLDHAIPTRAFQGMMEGLEKVQLEQFTFGPTFYEGRTRFLFGIQLMKSQNNLTVLKLVNLSRPNFLVWETALELMRRCSSSLKSIACDGCFCPENRPLDQFSCGILTNFKNLVDIQIAICGLKITDIQQLPRTVKKLHLGRGLSTPQIEFIYNNLNELVEWSLPQDRAQFDRTIPKTSVGVFKAAVKLPKLKTLILTKRCSSWKRIRKIISYTQGLEVGDRDPNDVTDAYYVKIVIDRNRLELDRL